MKHSQTADRTSDQTEKCSQNKVLRKCWGSYFSVFFGTPLCNRIFLLTFHKNIQGLWSHFPLTFFRTAAIKTMVRGFWGVEAFPHGFSYPTLSRIRWSNTKNSWVQYCIRALLLLLLAGLHQYFFLNCGARFCSADKATIILWMWGWWCHAVAESRLYMC